MARPESQSTGDQLAAGVNPQPWDPSVKSLTQFRTVLKTVSDSLSWTSLPGEAYYNQPADVLTFMINQDSVLVQKDLGPDSSEFARHNSEFNPDSTWEQVER